MVKDAAVPTTGQVVSADDSKQNLPGNLAVKCPKCKEILYGRDWQKNLKVCTRCGYHFKLTAYERIELLVDPESFVETESDIISADPLHFSVKAQTYSDKAAEERKKTGMNEGVVTGHATIDEKPLALAVMDFNFMGGSMNSAVGEKITRTIELGIERRIPILVASTSGGARMQEGLFSLMQMAKTASALAVLKEAKLPYFSLLTDPTSGGVTASFAMLGDVILAEPGALVCFAGPRVIEGFMHVKLPEGTASAEFVQQHGMIDAVIHRKDLRSALGRLLHLYS